MLAVARRTGLWRLTCAELAVHVEQVRAVSVRTYARPPWHEPAHVATSSIDRLEVDAEGNGVAAVVWADDALAGFAWLRPGIEDRRMTELVELAVDPAHQGRGLGALLHDALLPELDAGKAVLRCHPGARPAMSLLRSRGWRVATEAGPAAVLMSRALSGARTRPRSAPGR